MPIAAIILGVYLLLVVSKGNSVALLNEIRVSQGFLKWLIALMILWWLNGHKDFHPLIGPLLGIAAIAFVLNSLPKLQSQFGGLWNKL